jgi:hypothetical protein
MSKKRKLSGTYRSGTRNVLDDINKVLHTKCGPSYKVTLSQYRDKDADAAVYDEFSPDYDIILCLYHNDSCVSSITGKYNQSSQSMELLSKTNKDYEGKKINLYLRTIFIYLMLFIRTPKITTIVSHATNPISTYTMYKHYHASNRDLEEYVREKKLTPETFTPADAKQFHDYFNEKNKQTKESAKIQLAEMLEECSESMETECSLEDLGLGTEKEAIEFIISTMSDKAITLEVELKRHDLEKFLLNKLLSIPITCDIQGGRKSRRKSRRKSSRKSSRALYR